MITAILAITALLPQDPDRQIEAKLATLRVTMEFKDAAVEDVLDFVRDVGGLNVVLTVPDEGRKVSFSAKDITLKGALSLILKPLGLVWRVRDGVVEVTTKEKADEDVVLELYDLRDLLHVLRDFPGTDIVLDSDQPGAMVVEPDPPLPDELPVEELVKAHTGGKSWEENPKASIGLQNGILVVRQTREVHREIRRLIAKLRAFK